MAAFRQPVLSDRETMQDEAAIKGCEDHVNKAVFALFGVDGLPGE